MFDIGALRADFDGTKKMLAKRGGDYGLERFFALDGARRGLLRKTEEMKARQNAASKRVAAMKREGRDAADLVAEMKALSADIKALEPAAREADEALNDFLLDIPNIPHASVPDGDSEKDNVLVRTWGEPRKFGAPPLPHWEIGEALGIFDPATAVKIAGARFTMLRGLGARLERALVSFMLDEHAACGYEEIMPPYVANRKSMTGTGQLPDKEGQLYHLEGTDLFLIPTAETPLTNIHQDDILDGKRLPVLYAAYSPSFRKEAGAAGRDTRGLIRMHQFNKVEIFKITRPENSYDELEKLTADAERILQKLGLPYSVTNQCAGDLGFSNAKTYDINVWMPSYGKYVEVSSCSNFEAFQARRAGIRFRDEAGQKPSHAHTLNGSGLAANRTTAAILENFQNEDGTVTVPAALAPYMGGASRISKSGFSQK